MQELKKESIIVSGFVLLCVLDKVNVPFVGIAVLFVLPIVIAAIIYLGIKTADFKKNILQVIFSIYYKMFFILALFFALKDYPGKDIVSIVALSSAILYIVFIALSKTKKNLIVVAILYINLFSGFILSMSY